MDQPEGGPADPAHGRFVLGLRHPTVPDADTPLDPARKLIAIAVLIMFVLCFTPVPIVSFFGQ